MIFGIGTPVCLNRLLDRSWQHEPRQAVPKEQRHQYLFRAGQKYFADSQFFLAFDCFREAISLRPDHLDTLRYLVRLYGDYGLFERDHQGILSIARSAIEKRPFNSEGYILLGVIYLSKGEWELPRTESTRHHYARAALAAFQKALRINPKDLCAQGYLTKAYRLMGGNYAEEMALNEVPAATPHWPIAISPPSEGAGTSAAFLTP
jgi:tetratricopeptide (TPR) repeat protein